MNPEWKSFYEPFCDNSIFNLNHGDEHVKFTKNSGLDSVMYDIFKKFDSKEYYFYHIIVRAIIYDKFIESVDKSNIFPLPYQCLCDGGNVKEESRRHHKHMIIMVKSEYNTKFGSIWRTCVLKNDDNSKNKFRIFIKDRHHLMNVLYYVSNPLGSCDGTIKTAETLEKVRGSHYWINQELYPHAKVAISSLFKNGHQVLIEDSSKNKNVEPFYKYVKKINQNYCVELKYLGLKIRNCIIPFEKNYEISEYGKPKVFIYGDNWYLKENNKLLDLDFDSWYHYHLSTKNSFFDNFFSNIYFLKRNQVKTFHQLIKVDKSWEEKFEEKCLEYENTIHELRNASS